MSTQEPSGRLQGRRILVTGAASGIGRATARVLASEGARIAVVDRDEAGAAATAAEIGGAAFAVDITDEEAVGVAVDAAAAELGGLDGLVNAAGVMFRGPIAEVPADQWRRVIEINLTGAYIVTRSAIPHLAQGDASTIVNIASAQALLPNAPGYTAYAASKGGVLNLTRVLAAELAPRIRVNSVCPGMVDTAMADGYRANVSHYALGRIASPDEIARAILFLTSDDSSYVTGTALAVDGGRTFH